MSQKHLPRQDSQGPCFLIPDSSDSCCSFCFPWLSHPQGWEAKGNFPVAASGYTHSWDSQMPIILPGSWPAWMLSVSQQRRGHPSKSPSAAPPPTSQWNHHASKLAPSRMAISRGPASRVSLFQGGWVPAPWCVNFGNTRGSAPSTGWELWDSVLPALALSHFSLFCHLAPGATPQLARGAFEQRSD